MPAMAIMARRPLLSSFVCISASSAGFVGLRPSGSQPRSPGEWSVRMVHGWEPTGFWKVKTENTSGIAIRKTSAQGSWRDTLTERRSLNHTISQMEYVLPTS